MSIIQGKTTRRPRRTKAAVEEAIIEAAREEIMENGFSDAVVSNIVKRAQIEPRVFYLRYKDISDFYASFVKCYDYWFADLLKDEDLQNVSADSLKKILTSLLENLNENSVMLELLRWEIAKGNATTIHTASLRENHTLHLAEEYAGAFKESGIDIVALATLLISGIYYLVLHKDRSDFCGINLDREKDVSRLENAMSWLVDQLFTIRKQKDREQIIADRMRKHGIPEDIIKDCLS